MRKIIITVLLSLMMLTFAAPCHTAKAAAVSLNKTETTTYVGYTFTLTLKGADGNISWKSSNPKVAEVSEEGKVSGCSAGTAKITAEYGNKKYTCTVTVEKTSKDVEFELSRDGESYIVTGYEGRPKKLVIPATYKGKKVTGISENAFGREDVFTSVVIPDSITEICDKCFSDTDIKSVTLPDTVTRIGERAFASCYYLEEINLPEELTYIGDYAFVSCGKLKNIAIPDSVSYIGAGAFDRCRAITTDINIPEGVSIIYDSSFSGTGIRNVVIPKSVKEIQWNAFSDCSNLESVKIKGKVKTIERCAFSGCIKLKSINIPKSVESIGLCILEDTAWLKKQQKKNPLVIINGIVIDGRECKGKVVLPKTVKKIAGEAFYRCEGMTEIVIPDSVTEIGEDAFFACNGLTELVIPGSVKILNTEIFSCCSNLKKLVISEGVEEIHCNLTVGSFGLNLPKLEKLTLPSTVRYVDDKSFSHCKGLKDVIIKSKDIDITMDAFFDSPFYESKKNDKFIIINDMLLGVNDAVGKVKIPKGIRVIGREAFIGCSEMTEVVIPSGVEKIADKAFTHCMGLTKVTIPDTVKEIGNYIFSYCYGLKVLTVSGNVEKVEGRLFTEPGKYWHLEKLRFKGTEEQFDKVWRSAVSSYVEIEYID